MIGQHHGVKAQVFLSWAWISGRAHTLFESLLPVCRSSWRDKRTQKEVVGYTEKGKKNKTNLLQFLLKTFLPVLASIVLVAL